MSFEGVGGLRELRPEARAFVDKIESNVVDVTRMLFLNPPASPSYQPSREVCDLSHSSWAAFDANLLLLFLQQRFKHPDGGSS
jgi:hypothetical protein